MNFKDIFRNKEKRSNNDNIEYHYFEPPKSTKKKSKDNSEDRNLRGFNSFDIGAINFCGTTFNNDYSLKLSAVYRAVCCISDSIAQLPCEVFKVNSKGYKVKDRKNPLYNILNTKPNARMTRYTFISLLIQSMLLKGNGYALIMRNNEGKVEQLIFLPNEYVSIIPPKYIYEPVKYKVVGINGNIDAKDMIHLLNYTIDGVTGISTLQYARNSLGLYYDEEKYAENFFAGGCALGGFLRSETAMTPKQKDEVKEGFKQAFGRSGTSNGIAILDANLSYTPITIKPVDSMMLQNREFSIIDVARWFNVNPIKLMDLSKSSYSTVEATNIQFLTDTISPLLQKIELEFEAKLFGSEGNYDIRFDVSQLLRADRSSLANYYSTMFNIGAMSVNEIRKEIDLPSIQNGDENFVQVNLQTLSRATSETPETSEDIKVKLNENIQE